MKTNAKDAGNELIQDLQNTLTRRLSDGLANDAISTLTVGQLRQVVGQEVGAALVEIAGSGPATPQTARDGRRAGAEPAASQSGAFKLGPLLLIGILLALGFAYVRSLVTNAPSGPDIRRPAGSAPAPARVSLPRLDSIAPNESVLWLALDGVFDKPRLRSGNGTDM